MVCPRCIMVVRSIFDKLSINIVRISLGEVELDQVPTAEQMQVIQDQLIAVGFELLEEPRSILIEQIRLAVIDWARMESEHPRFSDYLQDKLGYDYNTISKTFSESQSITIERYAILQRIEYAKELLCYSQMTMSEIAYQLGYSSPAHLSAQFKQVIGMSPKAFREQKVKKRQFLTEI